MTISGLKKEIEKLEADFSSWVSTLNNKSIWLFVATLGIWSVDYKLLQYLALVIIPVMFFWMALQEHKNLVPFKKRLKSIEQRVESQLELDSDEQKARKYDLIKFRGDISLGSVLKKAFIYWIAIIYYTATFIYLTFDQSSFPFR